MHTITRTVIGTAGAAALSVGAFAGVAAAAPGGSVADSPGGFGAFLLTSGTDVAGLTCSPDAGTHPDAAKACDSIRAAGGDFNALSAQANVACPLNYMPTPASALGMWFDGNGAHVVNFSNTYGNACVASAGSGGVFGF
ncbi:SSI family serine proteinase inhibitor [Tomitella fengzijianii]|uniref:Subtilisin inhibitor domain-containing protein n=1 Tax=Tomitella fengzijianii TaxID=2597660 RepID=A0A516X4X9_9ACTN|nr:SSI family serine proteinase inhibitor [Tomitella fengzijianii]QDQ98138.1 hypothetical protein FO059_13500 [Tomitella fengzijianii]